MSLVDSLGRVWAVLLAATAVGWLATGALLPTGSRHRAERIGWSIALGCAVLIAFVPLSLAVGVRPGWIGFVIVASLLISAARLLPTTLALNDRALPAGEGRGEGLSRALLSTLIVFGVVIYALRALTEPMWANDFIAIWGLKGKTIFGAVGFPARLTGLEFAHPEYPLGLPLLYAGIAFLTGRWDDHAMALIFPVFQIATLLVIAGWLRRRGVSSTVAYLAAAVVAWFEPLYSGFLTGMAEVPLSFGALLLATSLADALEETDSGTLRRLAFAAALIAATKNEGLFLAVVGGVIALAAGKGRPRLRVALAALAPALLMRAVHLPWRGNLPLADFDFQLWSTPRVWDSLLAAGRLLGPAAWAGVALAVLLIVLGGRNPAGDRMLVLAAFALAAYVLIPAFAIRGPEWLVQTTFLRTTAALVPFCAAAVASRFPAR